MYIGDEGGLEFLIERIECRIIVLRKVIVSFNRDLLLQQSIG